MADDAGDRTEAPTPRRRQEAREEGRVARSADLSAAVALVAGLLLLKAFGPKLLAGLLALLQGVVNDEARQPGDLLTLLPRIAWHVLVLLGPLLGALVALTIVGTLLQFGWCLTPKRLIPDLGNLSPLKGVKQLFSKQSLSRLVLGLLKMAIVGAIAWTTIVGGLGQVLAAGDLGPAGVLSAATELIYRLALRLALVLLVLGIIDYLWQRYTLTESLKMTKQEVKDELKRMEGDPLVKRRQREVQLRVAMQRLNIDVPKADVVVTNPTEFAVALQYDEDTMQAPKLLAKGADLLALRIRQLAQQHGVPIVQRPPLARAIYAQVEVGQEIPPALYRAVAEVLAYVFQLSGRAAKAG